MLTRNAGLAKPAATLAVGPILAAVIGLAGPAAAPSSAAQEARAFEQPQLRAVSVSGAWRVSRGQGVTVGVLDTGVDASAPDLTGSVRTGPDYTAGVNPPDYRPPHLHGTFIASVIAGHGSGPGRAQGVMGVAPDARILSVRVILDDGEPGAAKYNNDPKFADAIGNGIYYAVRHGVRVINMSLGSPEPTRFLRTAVGYAISHGVVVVASAGNSGTAGGGFTPYGYPASYTGVISVAALNQSGTRASFSDRNASVVLAAPGVNVVGDGPGGEFIEGDGTSPAAAFVTGVVALIKSRYPGLSPALVEQALITTTKNRPGRGYNASVGFGEVDAAAALAAAGRLAAVTQASGLAPAAHFGPQSPAAIQVTHRNQALIDGYGTVSGAAAVCFLAAIAFLIMLSRRAARDRHRVAPEALPPWQQPLPPPGGDTFLPRRRPGGYADPPSGNAYGPPPGSQYSPPPGSPYGQPSGGAYDPPPGNRYDPPPSNRYGPPPGGQYSPPPGNRYSPRPGSTSGPPWDPAHGPAGDGPLRDPYRPES